MECNKDEAIRAKEIAERKVAEKDYIGAKKFALKAQNLYNQLDGLNQVLMTIDVYVSYEKKIGGDPDWYGILGVDPWADDESMRKKYRKLALLLHPDKNKCKGADGAFKLVSDAWGLLSDKSKRLAYNQKRSLKESQQRIPSHHQPASNGFQNIRARTKNNNTHVDSSSSYVSSNQKKGTFWTMCNRCRTQYEYMRMYLNQTLLCPTCQVGFNAIEKAPPPSVVRSHQSNKSSKYQASSTYNTTTTNNNYNTSAARDSSSVQWDSLSRMGNVNSRKAKAQAANVVQEAHERVKRGFEETQEQDFARKTANTALRSDRFFKKSRPDDVGASFKAVCSDLPNTNSSTVYSNMHYKMMFSNDIRKALKAKSVTYISKKLKELMCEDEDKIKNSKNSGSSDMEDISRVSRAKNDEQLLSINVPDSDFHNFDLDRTEKSFEEDQVWAAYDNDNGMPRFYARIQKVVSLDPFKMKISWLNSRSNLELGPIDWIGSGFTKTCGDFRTGRFEFANTLNSFSHKVKFTKGARGVIRIFPRKGDVWALYRNWSPEWNSNTPDETIHKYDIVEVLDGYGDNDDDDDDERCVTVIGLVKVAGFRAVFRRSTDETEVRKIPKGEMFRFSHQIPYYDLSGHQDTDNAPRGCWELDPAATPLEFLTAEEESGK